MREERPDSDSDVDEPKLGNGRRSADGPPPKRATATAEENPPEIVEEAEPSFFEDPKRLIETFVAVITDPAIAAHTQFRLRSASTAPTRPR